MENKKQNENKAAARSYMETILEGGIVFKDKTGGRTPYSTGEGYYSSKLDNSRIELPEQEGKGPND